MGTVTERRLRRSPGWVGAAVDQQALETGRGAAHWLVLAACAAGWLVLAALALLAHPDERGVGTHEQFGLPPCATVRFFDFPCPGCGVTTSVTHAVQGRPLEALRNQPFGLVVALLFALGLPWALVGHLRGRALPDELGRMGPSRWAWGLGGAMLAAWIYKIWLMFA